MDHVSVKTYETYAHAVEAARRGDQEAFAFLYESTYRDKFFIAQKYMRNEEDAQDVLQEAYMKAWKSLPSLQQPEKFPGWLSMIVANTALNSLKKKKDLPFSALEQTTEEGDTFAFEEEDWRKDYQPEHAFTDQETSELLKEMLDSLSEEQRLCMLMYYVEELPTNEIANIVGCSKNTVTSRLNYGRKNLKAKAEELEKKGYSLYGIAPLPLLLLLLRMQKTTATIAAPALDTAAAAALARAGSSASVTTASSGVATQGASSVGSTSTGGMNATAAAATATAAKTAGMSLGIKIAAAVIGVAVLGDAGFAVSRVISTPQTEQAGEENESAVAAAELTTGADVALPANGEVTSATDISVDSIAEDSAEGATTSEEDDETPRNAVDLFDLKVAEAIELLDADFEVFSFEGAVGLHFSFPDHSRTINIYPEINDTSALTYETDSRIATISVIGEYIVFDELNANMTWPEMKPILERNGIRADEPAFSDYNGDSYYTGFLYDGIEVLIRWEGDPDTTPPGYILLKNF